MLVVPSNAYGEFGVVGIGECELTPRVTTELIFCARLALVKSYSWSGLELPGRCRHFFGLVSNTAVPFRFLVVGEPYIDCH